VSPVDAGAACPHAGSAASTAITIARADSKRRNLERMVSFSFPALSIPLRSRLYRGWPDASLPGQTAHPLEL